MKCTLSGAALLLLLGCLGCGGRQASPSTAQGVITPAPVAGRAGLPPIPAAGHFLPQRGTSAATVGQAGDKAVSTQHAVQLHPALTLNAPAGQPAYALYRFDGVPGDVVTQVSCAGRNLGAGEAWVALADYAAQRWSYFPPQQVPAITLAAAAGAPGRFVSPGGDIYVAIMVFDRDSLTIDSVSINFANRFAVSGTVHDDLGAPVPDATVSSPVFQVQAQTDAQGNFTVVGLPSGDWPLVATKDGWTFYSNPAIASITTGDAGGVEFTGHQNGSHFLPGDPGQSDNGLGVPTSVDLGAGPASSSLSIIDDPADDYRFTATAPGAYAVAFHSLDSNLYFPYLELRDSLGYVIDTSYFAYRGDVRLQFVVVDAPQTLDVRCGLSGGGGKYELALEPGQCHALNVHVAVVINHSDLGFANFKVTATPAGGGSTEYLTDSTGDVADPYRAPAQTTVAAVCPGYTVDPVDYSVDLGAADQELRFTPTEPALPDSMEPNNDFVAGAANANLPQVYDSVGASQPLMLQGMPLGGGSADMDDFYHLSPPVGRGLRIELRLPGGPDDAGLLLPYVYNAAQEIVGEFTPMPGGLLFILPQPTDGGDYYLRVGSYGSCRQVAYELHVDTYEPHALTFQALLGTKAVLGAHVQLRDAAFTWKLDLATSSTGKTPPVLLPEGETVFAEFFRYGFDTDRHTRQLVVPDSDSVITFAADTASSADANEPNQDIFSATPTLLPIDTDGTLDPLTDPNDYYRLFAGVRRPLAISATFSDPRAQYKICLYNALGNPEDAGTVQPGQTLILRTGDNTGAHWLQLQPAGAPCSYHLEVVSPTAYALVGAVLIDAEHGPPAGRVYCPELGRYVATADWGGGYDFGYVVPGAYTLQFFAPGYAVQEHTVTVTDKNVVSAFTLNPAFYDAGEPDDTEATAVPLATDGTATSWRTIGLASDADDYYKFTATAGQLCQVTLARAQSWYAPGYFRIERASGDVLGFAGGLDGTTATVAFVAPASETYLVHVYQYPAEYRLQAKVIDQ